jgi:deazaflavin-dependent oxidoreductase (nitroreductase family)
MTAEGAETLRTPPRLFVRTAWVLHRALLRFSGRRIGLSRPEAGQRFGMMRLTTVGRRTGQPRVAIVGYFDDGENLVTLAMNGWADADPAWWLNLQAQPDTTVDLPDGSRAVRARAAEGAERERLWASFGDYPGWGDDLDALAARRSSETAVVVLERTRTTAAHPPTRSRQQESPDASSS